MQLAVDFKLTRKAARSALRWKLLRFATESLLRPGATSSLAWQAPPSSREPASTAAPLSVSGLDFCTLCFHVCP